MNLLIKREVEHVIWEDANVMIQVECGPEDRHCGGILLQGVLACVCISVKV